MVSPAVSVPVLVVTTTATIPVSSSFPGPSAALIPLGLPAGLATAYTLAASSAVVTVARVAVLAASAAASAPAPSAVVGANGCDPARGPRLANLRRQANDGVARRGGLLQRQRGPVVVGDLEARHLSQEAPHGSVRPWVHAVGEDPARQRPKPILEIIPKMVQVH